MTAAGRGRRSGRRGAPPSEPFRFSTEVRVRLPETDALGIVFHGAFFTFFEVGRMDYLRNLGLAGTVAPFVDFPSVVVHASADFRSPARFDDILVVDVRIGAIGRASFRFEFRIRHKKESRLVAEGKVVHVALDEKGRPAPVPDSFRAKVRAFETG